MVSGNKERPKIEDELRTVKESYQSLLQENEHLRRMYDELNLDVVNRSEELASVVIETTMSAMMSCREVFRAYTNPSRITRLKRWFERFVGKR